MQAISAVTVHRPILEALLLVGRCADNTPESACLSVVVAVLQGGGGRCCCRTPDSQAAVTRVLVAGGGGGGLEPCRSKVLQFTVCLQAAAAETLMCDDVLANSGDYKRHLHS